MWAYPIWVLDNISDIDKLLIGPVYKEGNILIGSENKNDNTL